MIKKNFVKILPTLNEIKSLTTYESKFFKKKKNTLIQNSILKNANR